MTTPPPPHGSPADPPAEHPPWGQQPSGGWGQPRLDSQDAEQATDTDSRGWGGNGRSGWDAVPGQQSYGARTWGQQPDAQQEYAQQEYAQPQYGQPQYGQPPDHGQPPYPDYRQQPQGPPAEQRIGGGQRVWDPVEQQGWGQQGPPSTQQRPGAQPQGSQPQGSQPWDPGHPVLPDPPAREGSGPTKLQLILGGAGVLMIALILVLGFVAPGYFLTRVFSAAAVQDGVQRVLTDDYGLKVGSVTCAEGVAVTAGASFDCDATIDGRQWSVPIRITSSDGRYEVGRPL